jgi:putative nucleotidyltransferase with HDIG domain
MNAQQLAHELLRAGHLMEPMRNVPQEPGWHDEGDVWTHVQMVREALETIPAFRDLPEDEQNALRLAAALHDIGKTTTTRQEEGRWRSPGHGRRGAEMLELHWWCEGYRLPDDLRALIVALVRYHGRPVHGEERLESHAAGTSILVRCDLLAILAEADMRGRTCPRQDKEDALLKIDLFRETAKELNCFSTPYAWDNDHARWRFFHDENTTLHWQAPDDRKFSAHILCGLPGSGKSHLSGQMRLPVISRDNIREENGLRHGKKRDEGQVSQLFQESLRQHLRTGQDFIIDGTNIIKNLRGNIIDLCVNYGARVEIHFIDRDRDTVLRQNRERETAIPETKIEHMAGNMEKPDLTECHALRFH